MEKQISRIVLDDFPFSIDKAKAMEICRVEEGSDEMELFNSVFETACSLVRPKAVIVVAGIEKTGEDTVLVDGVEIRSRMVRVNFEKIHRTFVFLATCGREIDDWTHTLTEDILAQFYAEEIQKLALAEAYKYLEKTIVERFLGGKGKISTMNPGSLKEWPIQGQREVFKIIGDAQDLAGVTLTGTCLMLPAKSVSGLAFEDDSGHVNCAMCPRETCPNRRAPYDAELYTKRFAT